MSTANKGEWSEFYVLLKLLADRNIFAADENINRIEKSRRPIIKIFGDNGLEYRFDTSGNVKIYVNDELRGKVAADEVKTAAEYIYQEIMNGKKNFEIDGADELMKKFWRDKIKADSRRKADIKFQVHDVSTGENPVCRYSIKSYLGSPPTLFNAGVSTNFKFELPDVTAAQIDEINSAEKFADKLKLIGTLNFIGVKNKIFAGNLSLICTSLEKYLAEMLKIFYRGGCTNCAELVIKLEENNFMNLERVDAYRYKIKKFLSAAALGMTAGTEWNGREDADSGYIIVKKSGEILAYHLLTRNDFETYLLNNTKFDTPKPDRHKFGKVYAEGGKYFIDLNLQVRFKDIK